MGQLVFQSTLGGQVNLVGPNTASTFNINVPAVAGNMVTTGDTGTVTNTMLAGSIANAKLTNSSVTVGSTSIALGATSTTLAGLTSVGSNLLTSAAATNLTLQSAGTTAVTIDTSQNVGIGTSSPTRRLDVDRGASDGFTARIGRTTGTAFYMYSDTTNSYLSTDTSLNNSISLSATGNYIFFTTNNGTERMRIDTSGNLLVGTTSTGNSNSKSFVANISNGYIVVNHASGQVTGSGYASFGYKR